MFERVIEFLSKFWDYFKFWIVVDQDEGGVILRFGKYVRTIGPGLHFKIPIADVDRIAHTYLQTKELSPQSLTTKDGKNIVITAIVKYRLKDVRPYLIEVGDAEDVLKDVTMGHVKNAVSKMEYKDITSIEQDIKRKVRYEVKDYGFDVRNITFKDQGEIFSLRLIQTEEYDE